MAKDKEPKMKILVDWFRGVRNCPHYIDVKTDEHGAPSKPNCRWAKVIENKDLKCPVPTSNRCERACPYFAEKPSEPYNDSHWN